MANVVSHLGSDFDALCRQALRQAPLADLVELRLDRIGDPGEARLAEFVKACPKPVIVAVHGPEAHGEYQGDVDSRLELLHSAARAGAKFVDVDWRLSLDLGEVAGRCHRIVSRHETQGTPERDDELDALWEEVRDVQYEGDVTKIVTHAASTEDGLRMLAFVRRHPGLIGFCSGEQGSFTRILAPIFGSAFTYAAPAAIPGMPAPEASAPGQLAINDLLGWLPPGGVTPETGVFAVVGRPARHSWSPRVHGMALKAAQLDAVYVALEPETLEGLLALSLDENFRGFSVTAPFKEEAYRLAASRDQASQDARAANTLVREGKGWRAQNTDVGAIGETLERAFALHARRPDARCKELVGATVLVLGTGGAARAAIQACSRKSARALVAGRRPEAAAALAAQTGATQVAWDAIGETPWDALVNCTPVGSLTDEGRSPIPLEALRPNTVVLDAVYRPLRTPLLVAARDLGCTAVPGAEWFVRQAEAQFAALTGQEADAELMRAAFDHALGAQRSEPSNR